MRGHGKTEVSSPHDENDFDVNTLSEDAVDVICAKFPTSIPPIILVGHRYLNENTLYHKF